MKYVMFKKTHAGLDHFRPVIFPNYLIHAEVAKDLMQNSLQGWVPDSAGEFYPLDGSCSGKSDTLNLEAKPERDTRMILMNDYNAGLDL